MNCHQLGGLSIVDNEQPKFSKICFQNNEAKTKANESQQESPTISPNEAKGTIERNGLYDLSEKKLVLLCNTLSVHLS